MPSPSPSTRDFQSSSSYTTTKTMSVAVLSPAQPAIYGQIPHFGGSTAQKAPPKRPKLSLNTSSTAESPYRSKQSTSLRLETLSATSPTARNTFGNAYARPARPSKPALPLPIRRDSAGPDTPVEQAIVIASVSPVSATCEVEPTAQIIPYKLSYDVNSILRNGPVERRRNRASPTKPIFSLTKRVIFRAPLTEEVKNKQYTLRHSDITSATTRDGEENGLPKLAPNTPSLERAGEELDNKHEHDDQDEDETMSDCPATPVAGRRKKDRHWYWTLGTERFHAAEPAHVPERPVSPSEPVDTS